MHYTQEVVINAPRDEVVRLFVDPEQFDQWQPDLVCYELVSGEQSQPGAVAELTTKAGSRVTGMTETIESNNLPDEIVINYETHGVWNRNANTFIAETPDTTRWVSENEFKFTGARKALALLEGSFKKESQTVMDRFKAFVER